MDVRTIVTTSRTTTLPVYWSPLRTLPDEWGIGYQSVEIVPCAYYTEKLPTIVMHTGRHSYNVRECDEFYHEKHEGCRKTHTRKDGITIAPYLLEHGHLHSTTYQEVWVVSKNGIVGLEMYNSYLAAVRSTRNEWPC